MELPVNRFKARLGGEPTYGCWLGMGNALSAEIIATAGFDWLLIDGEHAPNTVPSIMAQLRAVEAYSSAPIVRAVNHDPALIKQLLDIGAQSLMIPMVETGTQATELVRATRYPRRGIRGVATGVIRADRWGAIEDYLDRAADELCLIAQVESRAGVDDIEAIARTEGIDAVFIGPADLSTDAGHAGEPGHADVQALIENARAATAAAGKAAGILALDDSEAERYMRQGFDFVATASDVVLLRRAAVAKVQRHRPAEGG